MARANARRLVIDTDVGSHASGSAADPLRGRCREFLTAVRTKPPLHRAVFSDIVIKAFGKQGGLMAIIALNKSTHRLLLGGKS